MPKVLTATVTSETKPETREKGPRIDSKGLSELFRRIVPFPDEWLRNDSRASSPERKGPELTQIDCEEYERLLIAWNDALRWTEGLDVALSVMLASVVSTKSVGDQLWIKVISPASTGKTVLCEALSSNSTYTIAKSTIRGFHSGYRHDGAEDEDNSLIVQVDGKTLITKDGDTLLKSPNIDQILSEARDIYDGSTRSHYRNRMGKDYAGIRMTWILCGTTSLKSLDSSELGERFLDCIIMEGIDDELEDEVLKMVADKAISNLRIESDGKPETHQAPSMTHAKSMTAGYVDYLRKNANALLNEVSFPQENTKRCLYLGKFIAHMRARPSKLQKDTVEREFSARLASQLLRLAGCLTVVLNKTEVDDEVMKRVQKVAMDTAKGPILDIVDYLWNNPAGVGSNALNIALGISGTDVSSYLKFLRHRYIGVCQLIEIKSRKGTGSKKVYRLTDRFLKLYDLVMKDS